MPAIFCNAVLLTASRFIPDRLVFPRGVVAAALLSAYLVNLLLKLRSAKSDPSAKGCFSMVAIIVGTMLALLIVGLAFHIQFLTFAVFVITAVTVLFLLPDMVKITLRNWREKRQK